MVCPWGVWVSAEMMGHIRLHNSVRDLVCKRVGCTKGYSPFRNCRVCYCLRDLQTFLVGLEGTKVMRGFH